MKNKILESKRFNLYISYRKNINILLLIILKFLIILNTNGKLIHPIYYYSEIHLKVIGKGDRNILSNSFEFEPSDVKINGVSNNCKKVCNFQEEENNVIIYFNDIINNCENMFYLSEFIKEIDLSKFDFSDVTTTKYMFKNCTLLEKIEFGNNINTSSLKTMESMFFGCHNLTSLDLSKFNTNKVESFSFLLYYCKNLVKLNLVNINTSSAKILRSFFEHCEKLESIDISNFNTSSVTNMFHMFFHC